MSDTQRPKAYLGNQAGEPSYAIASLETVFDPDTGKNLKQILQEGGGGGSVTSVDNIQPVNGNIELLSQLERNVQQVNAVPLSADNLQGKTANDFVSKINKGDVIDTSNFCIAGLLTSNNTKIRFTLPMSSISADSANVFGDIQAIQNGEYIIGSSGFAEDISKYYPETKITPFGLYITLNKDKFAGLNDSVILLAGRLVVSFN